MDTERHQFKNNLKGRLARCHVSMKGFRCIEILIRDCQRSWLVGGRFGRYCCDFLKVNIINSLILTAYWLVFLTLFLTMTFVGSFSYATPSCQNLYTSQPINPFKPWKINTVKDLKVEDFLPKEFIAEVTAAIGPIKIKIINAESKKGLMDRMDSLYSTYSPENKLTENKIDKSRLMELVIGGKNDSEIIECFFIQDRLDPTLIELTGLRLRNPIINKANQNIRHSQDNKGLPYSVFRFLKARLFLFLKAGGYRTIKGVPQTYAVSQLYRKMIGFEPSTQESQNTYKYLDQLYLQTKNILPQHARRTPLDQFSRSLGDHQLNNKERSFEEVLMLQNKLFRNENEFYKDNVPILAPLGENNLEINVGFYFVTKYQTKVYFLSPEYENKILSWRSLIRDRSVGLFYDLSK